MFHQVRSDVIQKLYEFKLLHNSKDNLDCLNLYGHYHGHLALKTTQK